MIHVSLESICNKRCRQRAIANDNNEQKLSPTPELSRCLLRCDPYGLHDMHFLQTLITDNREHAVFWQRGFRNAVDIIESAIDMSCVSLSSDSKSSGLDRCIAEFTKHILNAKEYTLEHKRNEDKDFCVWIAGGYVVSEVLGYGKWSDIDVWFSPHCERDNTIKIPLDTNCFPV